MKKILIIFICVFYFTSFNCCFAVSNLYFVKNTSVSSVENVIENAFTDNKNYTLTKKNPYLAYLNNNSNDYIVIILQQSSNNLFYYFQSSNDKKIDNAIKSTMKKHGYVFEQSYNTNYLSTFSKQADKVLTDRLNKYDFSVTEQKTQSTTQSTVNQAQNGSNNVLKGYVGQIAKGTTFNVYLNTPLNTATASSGDEVICVLTEDWIYKNKVVASQGSIVKGHLTKARHATYGSRNGQVVIDFDSIITNDGNEYKISTEKVDFTITNEGKVSKTVSNIAKGAAIGLMGALLVAALANASGSDVHWGKSAAIGAGVGAGSAVITSTAEKGVDAEIPVFTELELKLAKPLNVTLY
ncbi:hypothetical protein IJG72_03375 [bacterium]|nr:hypothetical protein [bacterium]